MRLFTHEWGPPGDATPTALGERDQKLAILVHGITSDGGTWRTVAPALVERGYRVMAVDLRGHGASERGEYSPAAWASDLLETLPTGADLAIGHSLGGIALWLAVDGLEPERAVYVDPAWWLPQAGHEERLQQFVAQKSWSLQQVATANPRWSAQDVQAKHSALQLWDPATVAGVRSPDGEDLDFTPTVPPGRPSLVMLADPSELVPPDRAERLRELGFTVETILGAGHSIHRDDLTAFLGGLDRWLAG